LKKKAQEIKQVGALHEKSGAQKRSQGYWFQLGMELR
jgi:hypothetical protein